MLAVALLLTGVVAAFGGYVQFRRVDEAIRTGRPVGRGPAAHTLSLAMLVCLLLAALVIVRGELEVVLPVLCVDVGSTFTKAALVDTDNGELLATASHPTTLATDVLDGVDACREELARAHPAAADAEVLACSSAGGGLRIAVVGTEALVTAEAGRRVALSSGGKVAVVSAGGLDEQAYADLQAASPDLVLLVGGTDGGNAEVLEADAAFLAGHGCALPVVVAGNADSAERVAGLLAGGGTPYVLTDNVVPKIGVLAPEPARRAIREVFLRHVIGGKGLSSRADFTAMVQGPTPDLVLTGVELLAAEVGRAVAVVDIGGATTDVHSVVPLDPEDAGLSREVVASTPVTRTVEGDLGMRWSALSTWEAGVEAGLLDDAPARGRRAPGRGPVVPADHGRSSGRRTCTWRSAAATLAVRRHVGRSRVVVGPDGRVVERTGKDLREVVLLVGSGGVLRHAAPTEAGAVLAGAVGVSPEGWQQPEHPRVVVDRDYVLAAIGLLAPRHRSAAAVLARSLAACEQTPDF